jgi:hypothetical protein
MDASANRTQFQAFKRDKIERERNMPALDIILHGDGCWPDLKEHPDRVIHLADGTLIAMAALPGGMTSGQTSVSIRIDLPDGRVVVAETSLALLGTAVDMFRAQDKRQVL